MFWCKVSSSTRCIIFVLQAEDGIRDLVRCRGLGDVYKRQWLAVMIAVVIMLLAAELISDFVNRHATVKVLALAFLLMVGVVLFLDGLGLHVDKNYLYAAMGFCVLVEFLNLRMRKNAKRQGQEE